MLIGHRFLKELNRAREEEAFIHLTYHNGLTYVTGHILEVNEEFTRVEMIDLDGRRGGVCCVLNHTITNLITDAAILKKAKRQFESLESSRLAQTRLECAAKAVEFEHLFSLESK